MENIVDNPHTTISIEEPLLQTPEDMFLRYYMHSACLTCSITQYCVTRLQSITDMFTVSYHFSFALEPEAVHRPRQLDN